MPLVKRLPAELISSRNLIGLTKQKCDPHTSFEPKREPNNLHKIEESYRNANIAFYGLLTSSAVVTE